MVVSGGSGTYTGNKPRELDDETLELVRRRIGIPVRFSPREHNEVASTDSFRHFARGYGDANPLYGDPEHASASSWGGPIAPPVYLFSAGISRPVEWSDAQRAEMSGGDPLAGIGQYMCGERWLFVRPVRVGDVMYRSQSLYSAELKDSRFGDGVGALVTHRVAWEDGHGRPLGFRYLDYMHADREKSSKAGTNREIERTVYTDEDIERLDALYAAETVRGARRFFNEWFLGIGRHLVMETLQFQRFLSRSQRTQIRLLVALLFFFIKQVHDRFGT